MSSDPIAEITSDADDVSAGKNGRGNMEPGRGTQLQRLQLRLSLSLFEETESRTRRASIGCSSIRAYARRPALARGSSLAALAIAGVLLLSAPSHALDNE